MKKESKEQDWKKKSVDDIKDKIKEAKEKTKEKVEKRKEYTRKHPIKATLQALGVGAFIGGIAGFILGKRRRKDEEN